MSEQIEASPSLAKGDRISPEAWTDFVSRLRHDCVGEGVDDHCTADAIFMVEAREIVYGLDAEYSEKRVIACDETEYFSLEDYWDDLDEDQRENLDAKAQEESECDFRALLEDDQWEMIGELENHRVIYWDDRWVYVNSHFTKDAAEAFIKRKKHDYGKGLRVYVDAQSYCWEYNTIKAAILSGELTYTPKTEQSREA